MGKTRYSPGDGSVERARQLRQDSTPAEDALWSILRGSKLDSWKFRRQQRFGPYFADLACHDARLVLEADGDSHFDETGKRSDALRTAYIEREGYRVLRFTNHEIMANLDGVAEMIRAAFTLTLPPLRGGPLPLPQGERGL